MKKKFACPNCKKEISTSFLHLTTLVKCKHCHEEFIIEKHTVFYMIELAILITVVLVVKENIEQISFILAFISLGIFAIVFNYVYDVFFYKIIRKKNYFTLRKRMYQKNK